MLRKLILAVALFFTVALSQSGSAIVNNTDYLEAIGDFEQSHLTRWYAQYLPSIFDQSANTVYVDPVDPTAPNSRAGYSTPTSNDSVGDNWIKSTLHIDPWTNAVYKIVNAGGLNGTNCQYIALKGTAVAEATASIDHYVDIDPAKTWALQTGDTVTFKIDYIKMSDYSTMPKGASVHYYMTLGEVSPAKEIYPSLTAFSMSIAGVIPANITRLSIRVYLVTSGNIGTKTPGIYLDGAHLYVKRAGQSTNEQREVPVKPVRSIKTYNVGFTRSLIDPYTSARDYDILSESEGDADSLCVLRRLNPSKRVAMYQSGGCCLDRRDSAGKDRIPKEAALTYLEAMTSHPKWLYQNSTGGYINGTSYPERYQLHISDPSYQKFWADQVIEKATRLGYNGVFIDDLSSLQPSFNDGIIRTMAEVQQFIHAVYPRLKAAGLSVTQNECALHLDGSADWAGNIGKLYSDPFWTPDAQHPTSTGYSANSPDTVADVIFQEYAFFLPRKTENHYDKEYWLACLNDMDEVQRWNTALNIGGVPKLSDKDKRQIAMLVLGREFPNDPAYGADGWIDFGLYSYLLGQNNWTSIGFMLNGETSRAPYPNVDFSRTKQLGMPSAPREAYKGDPYCLMRRYKATADGGVGGIVIVNGNTDVSRIYTVDFNATDESGVDINYGKVITLKPHTGRILLNRNTQVTVRVTTTTATQNVLPGQTIDVSVTYSNISSKSLRNVIVRAPIPDQTTYVQNSSKTTGGTYDSTANTVSWVVPTLSAGTGGSKTFKVTVK